MDETSDHVWDGPSWRKDLRVAFAVGCAFAFWLWLSFLVLRWLLSL